MYKVRASVYVPSWVCLLRLSGARNPGFDSHNKPFLCPGIRYSNLRVYLFHPAVFWFPGFSHLPNRSHSSVGYGVRLMTERSTVRARVGAHVHIHDEEHTCMYWQARAARAISRFVFVACMCGAGGVTLGFHSGGSI